MGTACVGILIAGVLQSAKIKLSDNHREFAQMAVVEAFMEGGALFWIWLFLRENKLSVSEAFGLKAVPRATAVKWGLVAALLFVPVAVGLQDLVAYCMKDPQEQALVQELQRGDLPAGEKIFIGVLAVLVAPVVEEAIFRGILYPTVKQLGYPRVAIWVTSLLFALMHFNIPSFLPLAVFSALLIYLYEKTGSLLASITAHSLFNLTNFALLLWSVAEPVSGK
jgi:membrane protease YdiL (CAAX protease family)